MEFQEKGGGGEGVAELSRRVGMNKNKTVPDSMVSRQMKCSLEIPDMTCKLDEYSWYF